MSITTLAAAEEAVGNLVAKLDVPVTSGPCAVVLGIARQTGHVYSTLRRESKSDPTGIVGQILLRAIAEAGILVRWIELSPNLHVEMYFADDQRRRVSSAQIFDAWRKRRGAGGSPTFSASDLAKMKAEVARVRAKAKAAGEPVNEKTGPVVPTLEQMATATGDTASIEAYEIIYRTASPFTHSGGSAIAFHRLETRPDGEHLVIDGPYSGEALRAIATPSMAHLIGSTSRICGLGLEIEARIWQNAVIEAPRIY